MIILAFEAHPDYHVLWFGGTIAKHTSRGDEAYVISVSGGERGAPEQIPNNVQIWTREFGKKKIRDSKEGAIVLGIKDFRVLDFEDTKIRNTPSLQNTILDIIRELRPQVIISHWPNDTHPDIRETGQAVLDACFLAKLKSVNSRHPPHEIEAVYLYEVWNPDLTSSIDFEPDIFVDITETMPIKIEAAKRLRSVIEAEFGGKVEKWLDIFRIQNRYWGQKTGVEFAEPFKEASVRGMTKNAVSFLTTRSAKKALT
ncbi:MAG: PIG-L deacetylase family protein [Candidatus Bathyarchaeia archaeon]